VKNQPYETPVLQIERNPYLMLGVSAFSALLCWLAWELLMDMNPWGFILMAPAVFAAFHSLWFLLSPFASVFADRIEIRQSLFHHQQRYFGDIKKVNGQSNGKLYLVYNDDEIEPIGLFGIRKSQEAGLKTLFSEQVEKSAAGRAA
jgi:hypothetical protein